MRGRARQGIALQQLDAHVEHHAQVVGAFNSFRNDFDAQTMTRRRNRIDKVEAHRRLSDIGNEHAVDFHEIGLDSRQHLQAAIANTEIVDGDFVTLSAIIFNGATKQIVVVNGGFFRNLEDDFVFRQAVVFSKNIGQSDLMLRVHQGLRAHIDE